MATTRARQLAHRGFTLVELMVVVAIVGVVSALASVMFTTTPDLASVCEDMASHIAETSRRAVSGGPVRADVVAAEFDEWQTARALLAIEPTGYTVQVREEDDGAASSRWSVVRGVSLPSGITVVDVELGVTATTGDESLPDEAAAFPVDVACDPSGGCETATIYLQSEDDQQFRIVILPLNGTPLVLSGW